MDFRPAVSFCGVVLLARHYPYWYCPVWGCSFRTQYSKNIKKHLVEVHSWSAEQADREVSNFFDHVDTKTKVICAKNIDDPTYPRKKAWTLWAKSKAGLIEGSEASVDAERSVVGGSSG